MRMPFDTLDYAKKLEAAGASRESAQLQSQLLAEVLGRQMAHHESAKDDLVNRIDSSALWTVHAIENLCITLAGDLKVLRWMMAVLTGLTILIVVFLPTR